MTKAYWMVRLAALAAAMTVWQGCQYTGGQLQSRQQATQRWQIARADVKAQLAADQLELGRIDAAAAELDEALQLDPNNADLRLMQARVCLARGDNATALALLESLERDSGPLAEAHYLIGIVCQQRLQWSAAEEYFLSALEQSPREVAYLSAAVQARLQSGRIDQAWELLEQYKDDLGHTPAYFACVAECAESAGDWERASAAWRRVADAQDDPVVGERIALALYRAGKWSETATLIEQLISKHSIATNSVLHHVLAECLMELGELDKARDQLSMILKDSPRDAQAQWSLARVLAQMGESQGALRVAERALALEPENARIIELVATLAYDLGDYARAAALAQALARRETDNAVAQRLLSLMTADGEAR
ncbi:MAG: tetratricopeptide repeat protein [Phycisphaerae bacterium]|nr:tetratricopeptide repeat protein [Phycisphaerae bacterium]